MIKFDALQLQGEANHTFLTIKLHFFKQIGDKEQIFN